ncbi:MAG: NADH:flavin oxidoreductase/NADH oxidase [Planctomycetota bacterium]|jgi:2,4-dienoyl-CoA reductase-like NADH-dependent reductase (Old Yellow Enzyme family)
MPDLFTPLELRGVTLRNRIVLSPMCQYSSEDGFADDWHLAHYGARAVGGAGLVMTEATGVEARGRITPNCLGIWKDAHVPALRRVTAFIEARGSVPGIQLAHAGVKASRHRPWHPTPNKYVAAAEGGWMPVGPTAERYASDGPVPHELSVDEILSVRESFAAAAARSIDAGFRVVELHFAHGYLGHSFLSPLMNKRRDAYGGPFDHRTSFLLETVRAVRTRIPDETPLLVRLSCTDWVDDGWTLDDSVQLSRRLGTLGVDLVDCSSGGAVRRAPIPVGPGYQVPLAERIRAAARAVLAAARVGRPARRRPGPDRRGVCLGARGDTAVAPWTTTDRTCRRTACGSRRPSNGSPRCSAARSSTPSFGITLPATLRGRTFRCSS